MTVYTQNIVLSKSKNRMKTNYYFLTVAAAVACALFSSPDTSAQNVVEIDEISITEIPVECDTHYSTSWRDNWFIQLGAGAQMPFTEYGLADGSEKRRISAVYNMGFGHWFSPYLGFRISGMYGKMRYDFVEKNKAQMASANADLMWDMTTSVCGVNPNRVFSFIPFVGVGGTYTWDFTGVKDNDRVNYDSRVRKSQWTLPVSVGMQMRFRLCRYVDFFAEARVQFYGDNFNNYVQGDPIEANISAIGGLSFNIGGRKFQAYDPCNGLDRMSQLNAQINNLRSQLASTNAALAAANAQLPCPEVTETITETIIETTTPMLASVGFDINSDEITDKEMVNVYNVAQWMKANPDASIVIQGYADKNTGSTAYNQALSIRRAEAVKAALESYGVNPDNLSIKAFGSTEQPYEENNWNRTVIFSQQ